MKGWLRRLKAAVGMGLTWAVGWGLVGFAIELVHNIWPNALGSAVDIWPAALALPAFFGGVAFSAVLGIVGRRRRFDELSLPRFAAWGAVGGLLVSLGPAVAMALGVTNVGPDQMWIAIAALGGTMTLLGASSAGATLMLARSSEDRDLLDASDAVGDVGLSEREARELLGSDG